MTVYLDVDDGLLKTYLFYLGVLVLKVLIMSGWTSILRLTNHAVLNPEDAKLNKKYTVRFDDPDIERVRRAHRNDIESIPFFLVACFGYILTQPNVFIATNLIRLYATLRVMHTIVYAAIAIPQPARIIAWVPAYFITIYISLQVIVGFV